MIEPLVPLIEGCGEPTLAANLRRERGLVLGLLWARKENGVTSISHCSCEKNLRDNILACTTWMLMYAMDTDTV